MKVQNKDIDKIFKHGLEDPVDEIGYKGGDWDALEQMLDEGKPRKIVYWLPILGSVAAVLLVVFGWWMLRPEIIKDQKKTQQQVAVITQQSKQQQPAATDNAGQNKAGTQQVQPIVPNTITDNKQPAQQVQHDNVANNTTVNRQHINNGFQITPPVVGMQNPAVTNSGNNNAVIAQNNVFTGTRDGLFLTNASQAGIAAADINRPQVLASTVLPKPAINSKASDSKDYWSDSELSKPAKNVLANNSGPFRPQFALTIIAAPELNGMNAVKQSNTGGNFGLLFSAGIFKKLTVTTGASYSIKPYAVGFSSYHTAYKFKTAPETITADCRLLDIPLNVDYQVYSRGQNKISLGTGVSSYIMLHESYNYSYADPATTGPTYYAVKKPGKYMFSIMNLQATYQRQINSKFGLSVQPYLKLPLSDIGYSEVKLQTVGVAVGLSWNINSLTKPK
jgi:hypothetical protein